MPHLFDEESHDYFERLNAQLRRMPQADRAEIHAEVRQHLDELTKAHEELGASPEEAARAALRQFGDPKQIGRRLFSEWKQSSQKSVWHIAGWAYLRLCVPRIVLGLVFITLLRIFDSPNFNWLMLISYLMPLFVGAWAGRRFGKKSIQGLLLMSGIAFLTSPLVSWIFIAWDAASSLFMPPAMLRHYALGLNFQGFHQPIMLLTSAWLAQKFDGPSHQSPAGVKSRFRR